MSAVDEPMRRCVGRGAASALNSGRLKRVFQEERLPHTHHRKRFPRWKRRP